MSFRPEWLDNLRTRLYHVNPPESQFSHLLVRTQIVLTSHYYRRHLPHYQPPEATFFLTFRLAGTLPSSVVEQLRLERASFAHGTASRVDSLEVKREAKRMRSYFEKFEELLDGHTHGPLWLAIPAVAQIVFDAIRYRDGREYRLYSACVMPNHVHLLIHVTQNNIPGRPLFRILQSLKRYTAREANNILARSGPFWQNESYDHVVRNEEELSQLFWYVVFNPVKAGLVGDWKEWRWTYADPEFKAM